MLAEPIVKILIHVKDHANALQFDALFFTIILVAFSKAESQCCTVLRSVTYESWMGQKYFCQRCRMTIKEVRSKKHSNIHKGNWGHSFFGWMFIFTQKDVWRRWKEKWWTKCRGKAINHSGYLRNAEGCSRNISRRKNLPPWGQKGSHFYGLRILFDVQSGTDSSFFFLPFPVFI